MSWNTRLSRTRTSTLDSLGFAPSAIQHIQGLEDLLRTVQTLGLKRYPYNDIERDGIAGEGETYLVEKCIVESDTVAVKHLKLESLGTDASKFRRRLNSVMLELRIMRHTPLRDHPNILKLLAYGWNNQQNSALPYILVEFSPYGHFREFLQGNKSLNMLAKEILISDVAAGLSALHLCGIVHGDVKLENALVFRSWDRPAGRIVKLCDFGHSILTSVGDRQGMLKYWGSPL